MPFQVTIENTGEAFRCRDEENVLRAMEQLHRKGIPVGCRNGGCGVCKVRVLSGSVRTLGPVSSAHVTAQERANGYTLACRVAPTEAVRLEVAGRLNKPFSLAWGKPSAAPANPAVEQTNK